MFLLNFKLWLPDKRLAPLSQLLSAAGSAPQTPSSNYETKTLLKPEMGIYRDNLSAIIYYRLSLSLKINLIYRLPISLLLYILLPPKNYRDKRFFMHAVFKLQS